VISKSVAVMCVMPRATNGYDVQRKQDGTMDAKIIEQIVTKGAIGVDIETPNTGSSLER
jgi:hypothetical protein